MNRTASPTGCQPFRLALAAGLLFAGAMVAGAEVPDQRPGRTVAGINAGTWVLLGQLPPDADEDVGDSWNWAAIIGVVALFGLLGTIAYLVIKGQGKTPVGEGVKTKKRVGGVTVTDNQIDSYRLVNLMMQGQTSQVWEAAEVSSGRHFALKMLLPEHVKSAQQRYFLFHEAEVGRQIVHPKIIKMLQVIKDPVHPYVIMEFFPSTNLKLRIMHKETFVKEHFKTIVEQAAMALAFMHEKGWVHRDVKPDNILVNASAEVRIIDFALAQRMSKRKGGLFKKKGKIQGTRSYMSPEQIRGEGLDARADLYSFGATLYEMLTDRPPFRASNPQDLLNKQIAEQVTTPQVYNPDIGDELANLILRTLAKRREDRPKDMHEFLAKFRSLRLLFKSAVVRKKNP
jgi:serine/threonine protein kinase